MQEFLEALLNLTPENLPDQRDQVITLVNRVHQAYLRRGLGTIDDAPPLTNDDLTVLRRLALYLEAEISLNDIPLDQGTQDAIYVAATLFEFLGMLQGPRSTDSEHSSLARRLATGDLADYTRAMLLYSLGRHEANSGVIGRRLLATLDSLTPELSLSEQTVLTGLRTLIDLVSRELSRALVHGVELGALLARMRNEWHGSAFPRDDASFLAVWLEIAEGCTIVAAGLLYGTEEVIAQGRLRLAQAAERAISLRQPFAFWAADRVSLQADQMHQRSVFRVLANKSLPRDYLVLLAATRVSELWTSQMMVIEAGLLDNQESFVINFPAGAGKSLIAEMAIVQALQEQGAWALYVVPSRSLVHQVESDLRARLPSLRIVVRTILAQAEPSLLDSELEELTSPHTLTILTPEKLDIYFRNQADLFQSCRLLVVDEAHKIADASRGPLIDTLLTRFHILVPQVRLLLLSSAIRNVLEISTWLGNASGGIISPWRPTRQLKGLAVRYRPSPPPGTLNAEPPTVTQAEVRYTGGIIFAREANDLTLAQVRSRQVDLPQLFEDVEKWQRVGRQWRRMGDRSPTDHAITLAQRFARLHGVVVVFTGRRDSAEKCAREIAARLRPEDRTEIPDNIIHYLEILLGPTHLLVKLMRRGVGYHHAYLPVSVQRIVEAALRDGWLRVVCATATLQEGLNTPATTVIIAGQNSWDVRTEQFRSLTVADFNNIAGRAGRAGRDTEGQVIFVPSNLITITDVLATGQTYLFPAAEAFRVQSALRALLLELESAIDREELPTLSKATEVVLLALQAAGLASEERLQRFFATTLAAHQLGRDTTPISRVAHRYLAQAMEVAGATRLDFYARTGLSIQDCHILVAALERILAEGYDVLNNLRIEDQIDPSRLTPLITAVLTVPEFELHGFTTTPMTTVIEILTRWMNGATFSDSTTEPVFKNKIEKVVQFLRLAARQLAWGLGSAYLLLETITDMPINSDFALLPLFVEFGVNTAPAAYLSLLGVSERESANTLGQSYLRETYGSELTIRPSFEEVERWMRSLTSEAVNTLLPRHQLRTRILLDDLGLQDQPTYHVVASDRLVRVVCALDVLRDGISLVGEFCAFEFEAPPSGRIYAVHSPTATRLGYVQNAPVIYQFAPGRPNNLFGIVVAQRIQPSALLLDLRIWRPLA